MAKQARWHDETELDDPAINIPIDIRTACRDLSEYPPKVAGHEHQTLARCYGGRRA